MFATDDPDHMGFKSMINTFYDYIFDELENIFTLKDEAILFEYSKRINEYIMRKLNNLLWQPDRDLNPADVEYK